MNLYDEVRCGSCFTMANPGTSTFKANGNHYCDVFCYLEQEQRCFSVTACIKCKNYFLPNTNESISHYSYLLCSRSCWVAFSTKFNSFCRGCGEFFLSTSPSNFCKPECSEAAQATCCSCMRSRNETNLVAIELPDGRMKQCCDACFPQFQLCLKSMCYFCCEKPPRDERTLKLEFVRKQSLLFCNADCIRKFISSRTNDSAQNVVDLGSPEEDASCPKAMPEPQLLNSNGFGHESYQPNRQIRSPYPPGLQIGPLQTQSQVFHMQNRNESQIVQPDSMSQLPNQNRFLPNQLSGQGVCGEFSPIPLGHVIPHPLIQPHPAMRNQNPVVVQAQFPLQPVAATLQQQPQTSSAVSNGIVQEVSTSSIRPIMASVPFRPPQFTNTRRAISPFSELYHSLRNPGNVNMQKDGPSLPASSAPLNKTLTRNSEPQSAGLARSSSSQELQRKSNPSSTPGEGESSDDDIQEIYFDVNSNQTNGKSNNASNGDRSTDRITSSNSSIVKMLTDNNSSNNTVSSAATKPMASLWHSFLVQHDNQLHKKDGQPVRASVASEGSSGNVFERLHLVDSGKSREEARKDATSKEKSTDNNDRHDNSEMTNNSSQQELLGKLKESPNTKTGEPSNERTTPQITSEKITDARKMPPGPGPLSPSAVKINADGSLVNIERGHQIRTASSDQEPRLKFGAIEDLDKKLTCDSCACTISFEQHPTYTVQHSGEDNSMAVFCSRNCRRNKLQLWTQHKKCMYCNHLKPVDVQETVAGCSNLTFCSRLCFDLYKEKYYLNCGVTMTHCGYCGKCITVSEKERNNDNQPGTSARHTQKFCSDNCRLNFKKRIKNQAKCETCMKRSISIDMGVNIFWKGKPAHFCDKKCLLIFYENANFPNYQPIENSTNLKRKFEEESENVAEVSAKALKTVKTVSVGTEAKERKVKTRNVQISVYPPSSEKSVQCDPGRREVSVMTEAVSLDSNVHGKCLADDCLNRIDRNDVASSDNIKPVLVAVPVPYIVFIPVEIEKFKLAGKQHQQHQIMPVNRLPSVTNHGSESNNALVSKNFSAVNEREFKSEVQSIAKAEEEADLAKIREAIKDSLNDQNNVKSEGKMETRKVIKLTEKAKWAHSSSPQRLTEILKQRKISREARKDSKSKEKIKNSSRNHNKHREHRGHKIKHKHNSELSEQKRKNIRSDFDAQFSSGTESSDNESLLEKTRQINIENVVFNFEDDFENLLANRKLPSVLKSRIRALKHVFDLETVEIMMYNFKTQRNAGRNDSKQHQGQSSRANHNMSGKLTSDRTEIDQCSQTSSSVEYARSSVQVSSDCSDDDMDSLASIKRASIIGDCFSVESDLTKSLKFEKSKLGTDDKDADKEKKSKKSPSLSELFGISAPKNKKWRKHCSFSKEEDKREDKCKENLTFSKKCTKRVTNCMVYALGFLYQLKYGSKWYKFAKHQKFQYLSDAQLEHHFRLLLNFETEKRFKLPIENVKRKVWVILYALIYLAAHDREGVLLMDKTISGLRQNLTSVFKNVAIAEWKKIESREPEQNGRGNVDNLMWMSGVLGDRDAMSLQFTVSYFIVREFGIFSLGDHKLLTRSHFHLCSEGKDQATVEHLREQPESTESSAVSQSQSSKLIKFRSAGTVKYDQEEKRIIRQSDNELYCPSAAFEKYCTKIPESPRSPINMFYKAHHSSYSSESKHWYSMERLDEDTILFYLRLSQIVQSGARFMNKL